MARFWENTNMYIVSGEDDEVGDDGAYIQVERTTKWEESRPNMVHTDIVHFQLAARHSYHIVINKIPLWIWSAKFYASFGIFHS